MAKRIHRCPKFAETLHPSDREDRARCGMVMDCYCNFNYYCMNCGRSRIDHVQKNGWALKCLFGPGSHELPHGDSWEAVPA